ncbi:RNA polymerase sigma factor [Reichenbachiella sp. MALMAid0571]|uniref:RNA polymerase sigma factor n=1 Tax=Reichenbachiella sp. MALMAid0571 TaxID=3143939 RepID=UPI0032DEDB09
MGLTDQEILKGCIKGDREAQQMLYAKYAKQMYVVCLRYAKEQQEAEDILQESFIKVFENIKNFRGDSKLVYWIKRIVINTALNAQRSKLYLYPMVDVDSLKESQGNDLPVSDFTMEELMKMINELPSGCKVIFNLYAIEGYKHYEIAKMLDLTEGTSKSQYSRAKYLLREQMQQAVSGYSKRHK